MLDLELFLVWLKPLPLGSIEAPILFKMLVLIFKTDPAPIRIPLFDLESEEFDEEDSESSGFALFLVTKMLQANFSSTFKASK